MTEAAEETGGDNACAVCGQDFAFTLPKSIVEAANQGRLLIFAGAGVSTESQEGFPTTFFDEIKGQVSSDQNILTFPALMSAYENEFGRQKLIEEIIERLRYAENFPSLRNAVTRFHRELSSIPQIQEIITTNWDSFFEEECGALPIVLDGDFVFHNIRGRKVYKIHGSIRNVSTIVATEADYKRTQSKLKNSAVGGTLRHLLASKIVVYIGYSLNDSDFLNVYKPLMKSMGNLRPVSYWVTPHGNEKAKKMGLHHLKTSGTEFMRSLKAHLIDDKSILPDSSIDRALTVFDTVREARDLTLRMDWRNNPEIIFSIAYQDGLVHALERIESQRFTGEYNSIAHVRKLIQSYAHVHHTAVEKKRIYDAAYINGYLSVLFLLLFEQESLTFLPLYEVFDDEAYLHLDTRPEEMRQTDALLEEEIESESPEQQESDSDNEEMPTLLTEDALIELLSFARNYLPEVMVEANNFLQKTPEGLTPYHTPFLDGVW